jgi:hypothetical protein
MIGYEKRHNKMESTKNSEYEQMKNNLQSKINDQED